MAKYVVSGSLETADWANTTILREPDEIAALKQDAGKDIVVTGSAALADLSNFSDLTRRMSIENGDSP